MFAAAPSTKPLRFLITFSEPLLNDENERGTESAPLPERSGASLFCSFFLSKHPTHSAHNQQGYNVHDSGGIYLRKGFVP